MVASGYSAETMDGQLKNTEQIYESGVDAVVLLSNRFVEKGERAIQFFCEISRVFWKKSIRPFLWEDSMPNPVQMAFNGKICGILRKVKKIYVFQRHKLSLCNYTETVKNHPKHATEAI